MESRSINKTYVPDIKWSLISLGFGVICLVFGLEFALLQSEMADYGPVILYKIVNYNQQFIEAFNVLFFIFGCVSAAFGLYVIDTIVRILFKKGLGSVVLCEGAIYVPNFTIRA